MTKQIFVQIWKPSSRVVALKNPLNVWLRGSVFLIMAKKYGEFLDTVYCPWRIWRSVWKLDTPKTIGSSAFVPLECLFVGTRWYPPSYKLGYNPHENFRYSLQVHPSLIGLISTNWTLTNWGTTLYHLFSDNPLLASGQCFKVTPSKSSRELTFTGRFITSERA